MKKHTYQQIEVPMTRADRARLYLATLWDALTVFPGPTLRVWKKVLVAKAPRKPRK